MVNNELLTTTTKPEALSSGEDKDPPTPEDEAQPQVRRRIRRHDSSDDGALFPNRRRTGIRISGSYGELNVLLQGAVPVSSEPRKRPRSVRNNCP